MFRVARASTTTLNSDIKLLRASCANAIVISTVLLSDLHNRTVVKVVRDALGLGGPAAGEGGGGGGVLLAPPPELATTRERAHVAGVLAQIRSERAEG